MGRGISPEDRLAELGVLEQEDADIVTVLRSILHLGRAIGSEKLLLPIIEKLMAEVQRLRLLLETSRGP